MTVQLQSAHSDNQVTIRAHILQYVTGILPTRQTQRTNWTELELLQLADPDYSTPRPIDILIGADNYGLIIKPWSKQISHAALVAQETIFGWILIGRTSENSRPTQNEHHASSYQSQEQLQDILTKFWVQEEIPESSQSQLSPEEQECEDHYVLTHSRDKEGRYVVKIPLKGSVTQLGNSAVRAQQCLKSMIRRLDKNCYLSTLYHAFMKEYEDLGHMVRAPIFSSVKEYYLPHHGVLKEDNVTTKLRVVFNGSSPTTSGTSLNDLQHIGPKIQKDIADVLLWIRKHKLIFTTDISKMYRQIKVHEDDWDLQRIYWLDKTLNMVPYHLTTVTYGTRSAPFLAVRTMIQLVKDEGYRFPLAVDPILKGRYVDDIFGGADTLEQLTRISEDVTQLCMAGGFQLAKWHSNSVDFLKINSKSSSSTAAYSFDDSSTKLLGLSWVPRTDTFKFTSKSLGFCSKFTKRKILSETAQLYDPLGFLAPFIVRAKMLLQELWLEQLPWDEPVPEHLKAKWLAIREELTQVEQIAIPRWLQTLTTAKVELHGFSDASQLAMAAVVYVKSVSGQHNYSTIVCSKSKVAPLKKMTIPRLELTAALLLAKLMNYVQLSLDVKPTQVHCWTDSTVALTWIRSHSSRWKEFVRNRVSKIQELTPISVWKFVPGKENPADCASRGVTMSQLKKHQLWWTGPQWLLQDNSTWPTCQLKYDSLAQAEERSGVSLKATTAQPDYHWDMIYRFSRLTRLLRVTAICFRLSQRLRRVPQSSLQYPLTPQEIEGSRMFWIKATQESYFSSELKALQTSRLPTAHPFNRLTAFIDTQSIIRVGGRISQANLDSSAIHPIILPQNTHLSRLIIADAHERTLHGGTQATMNLIRCQYWILGGRKPVKAHIYHCMKCARQRGKRAQQLMGQLPQVRITPSRSFAFTGVDYAGPLTLRTWKGRGAKTCKGWLCVFVCLTTSAIHIEVVSDYSSDSFVAAFRRFTGRRGICKTLYSDCGTTFQGADTELKRLFTQWTREAQQLACILTNDGTDWKFNPPAAPHMGGKWEAAVKSIKHHLNRTVGDTAFTFEELSTLMTQIEAVLNSRPLEPLSNDPDDLAALTPAHFLIGEPLITVPGPSLLDRPLNRLTRWQLIQQRLQYFWSKWSTQYLQRQLSISKWHHPSHEIKVGSLVLLTDERLPPSKWPLARVIQLIPGKDGLTRVVRLKTSTTELIRPIVKLAVLPFSPNTD